MTWGWNDATKLQDLRDLLKGAKPAYVYRWRVPDDKVELQGKHQPSQWDIYAARVRARLKKAG